MQFPHTTQPANADGFPPVFLLDRRALRAIEQILMRANLAVDQIYIIFGLTSSRRRLSSVSNCKESNQESISSNNNNNDNKK